MTDKQYELNYEILRSLDKIDNCVTESQFDVLISLYDVYDKSHSLSEMSDVFMQENHVYQEADNKIKEILNPKNLLKRFIDLLKTIGDLIIKFISRFKRDKDRGQIISNIIENQDTNDFPLVIEIQGVSKKREAEVLAYVKANITKKGNLDHYSSNQKVLAIIDRVTNERLNTVRAIGLYAPAVNNQSLKLHDFDNFKKYYNSKGDAFINKYVHKITVGEIDKHKSFKATHWFNNDTIKKGSTTYDNAMARRTAAESFITKRGVKLNDLKGTYFPGSPVEYSNPSKKDQNDFERLEKIKSRLKHIDYKHGPGSEGIDKKRKLLDDYNKGKPISESFVDEELFQEASHGKLKYDFRQAFDFDTGHAIKIVYSLDGIDIDSLGDGWKSNDVEFIAKIEKNILIQFKDKYIKEFIELIDFILKLQNEYNIERNMIDSLNNIKKQISENRPVDIESFQNIMNTLSQNIKTISNILSKMINGNDNTGMSNIKTDMTKITKSLKYITGIFTKLNMRTSDIK